MMINQVTQQAGAHRRRKRVGRGESSGWGRTSTRGNKGAKSRSGVDIRPLAEGGQMPFFRRVPKRGFSNFHFRTEYQVVNLLDLEAVFNNGDSVTVAQLAALGEWPADSLVKILGHGELTKKLTVECHAASEKAKAAIEKAGGSLKLLEQRDTKAQMKAKRNLRKKEPRQKVEAGAWKKRKAAPQA